MVTSPNSPCLQVKVEGEGGRAGGLTFDHLSLGAWQLCLQKRTRDPSFSIKTNKTHQNSSLQP